MRIVSTYRTLLDKHPTKDKERVHRCGRLCEFFPSPYSSIASCQISMYLLTKWEDRTGTYLAPAGQDSRAERSEVLTSQPRAKYFPVRPARPHSVSLFLNVSVSHQLTHIDICLGRTCL